tara:strand:+ start:808 stop:1035 length:228 start_codon:yes stop_codon:yes gene_type:complete
MSSPPSAPIIMGIHNYFSPPVLDLTKSQKLNDMSTKGISDNLEAMRLMGVKNVNQKKNQSITSVDKEALKILRDA